LNILFCEQTEDYCTWSNKEIEIIVRIASKSLLKRQELKIVIVKIE